MTANYPLFLIPLLPLLGAAFCLLVGRRAGKGAVTLVACGSVAAAALVTLRAVLIIGASPGGALVDSFFTAPFIKAGDLTLSAGLLLDRLSSVLCMVVTGVGLLIHIYATAYMEHDDGYARFFGYLNLFMGAMLILVLGDSMPITFVGWEGVGLCSYLLIGFWYDNESFAFAGRKAFIVNRVGDFGFLLAMALLFARTGTLKYGELGAATQLHQTLWWGMPAAYFIGLLVLLGATGKSAQIPLYVWLPDAMAGPTPVSALIHAATMVTAGVYVVTRMHVVFEAAPPSLLAVAYIGAATALFAATIGIAQRDMKKVLAYSTISQLGFMFAAVGSYVLGGSSNYHAGIFHLMTHAFFKAGLFLGAGSVMHALDGEGDITRMGGLKKHLPHTRWTFLIFCLAIAGIPPFAGFWSKDAILAGALAASWQPSVHAGGVELFFAHHTNHILYGMLLAAAACTAFYMFRLYFLIFEGEPRGDEHHHPHESPPAMTVVLWILAAGSALVGLLGIPDALVEGGDHFGAWLTPVVTAQVRDESAHEFLLLGGIATAVSVLAIGLAWLLYGQGFSKTVRQFVAAVPRLYRTVLNKYYVDEIYDTLVVRPLRWFAFILWKAADSFIIDLLLVNGTAFVVTGVGKMVKYLQNGDVQRYVVAMLVGGAAMLGLASNYAAWSASKFDVEVSDHDVLLRARSAPTAKQLEYRVDWGDGDHAKPQRAFNFHHTYHGLGPHQITVSARDLRWNTVWGRAQDVVIK